MLAVTAAAVTAAHQVLRETQRTGQQIAVVVAAAVAVAVL
jgi:hypothetical protein